ncbi:hypothetical protein [Reyranella sp.]|uniref:hypothetical protein n=1 Tax=Reyranella sp. TaxID=1929291 RepID=UPI003BABF1DB
MYFLAIIRGLEADFRFNAHLHNGDPLTARTVRAPAGRPAGGKPPFTWEESAQDAIAANRYDKWNDWSIAGMLVAWERYNASATASTASIRPMSGPAPTSMRRAATSPTASSMRMPKRGSVGRWRC